MPANVLQNTLEANDGGEAFQTLKEKHFQSGIQDPDNQPSEQGENEDIFRHGGSPKMSVKSTFSQEATRGCVPSKTWAGGWIKS